jgi:ribosomal protein S18 acetylase RimI-like enzyme
MVLNVLSELAPNPWETSPDEAELDTADVCVAEIEDEDFDDDFDDEDFDDDFDDDFEEDFDEDLDDDLDDDLDEDDGFGGFGDDDEVEI